MVEAVVEAIQGLENVFSLRLRQHPFDPIEAQPGFGRLASWLNVSANSLEEDFNWTDLVLISQSTVGDEAILAGKPVWQFRIPHPNRSALAECGGSSNSMSLYNLGTAQGTARTYIGDRGGWPIHTGR